MCKNSIKVLDILENYEKYTQIYVSKISLQWYCESIMKRSDNCLCMKNILTISTMLYVFDSDVLQS